MKKLCVMLMCACLMTACSSGTTDTTPAAEIFTAAATETEAASEAETTAAATEAETEVAATEVDKTVVSEQAKAIIEAVMNAPNPDLSFYPYMTTIGLDTSQDELESQMAETQEAKEQVYENWDNLLGQYFAAGMLDRFISEGISGQYLMKADMEDIEISVKDIQLVERGDYVETVLVNLQVGDQEESVTWEFTHDEAGLITKVRPAQ